jgi:hypothetical protein
MKPIHLLSRMTGQGARRLGRLSLLLPALCLAGRAADQATAPGFTQFITRSGDRLYEGKEEFRYISVNMPDVLQIISNYRFDGETPVTRLRIPDEYEQRDALRTVRQLGGRVVRTFVITSTKDGNPMAMFDVSTHPVVPHEPALLALDRLLQIANEEGVRLLIPLIAYKSALRGDPDTYGPDFWKVGSATNLKFKNMLTQLLGRTNTLTGRAYRDDPAVFGWHTGNELVIGDDPDRRRWLHDIAAYIKQLAPHQLLIDGRNKPNDLFDRYDEFAHDANLDAVSYHTYVNLPQADTPAGTLRLIRSQLRGQKPLLVTEVAMYTKPAALRELLDEIIADGTVGANWWGLRFHNRDGGFYKHSDRASQYEDLNWPGFTDPDGQLPEVDRERELLVILRDYAARITGRAAFSPEVPMPPRLLPAPDPAHLAWQGSTGASDYEVQRAPARNGPWTSLVTGLGDHLATYTPLYNDATATIGADNFYRVIARNATGASTPSNVIGPLRPAHRWLIDDLMDDREWDAASANLQIERAYAHDQYLEDIGIVHRANPAQAGRLVYQLAGPVRSFTLTAFACGTPPTFFLHDKSGARIEVSPQRTTYQEGQRARFSAELPANTATRLEIEFPAGADPKLAIGRVEIAYAPST